jgi:flagellar protein FliJ
MKRYQFRGEKVLRVRRLQEDMARASVAGARRDEETAQAKVDASQQRYTQLSAAAPAQSSAAFLMTREQATHRAGAVTVARQRRQAAADATAEALDSWRDINRKVQGLERLDERRRADHHIEVRRDEDAQVDEIVIARARRAS